MAKFNNALPGFIFKPIIKKAISKPKRKVTAKWHKCKACGWSEKLSTKFGKQQEKWGLCSGCQIFFGTFDIGVTNLSPEHTIERITELKKHKYGIILKSGNFSDPHTGDNLNVEFGDIFQIVRCGSNKKATSKITWAMEAFTVDVMVNNRPVKLFMHEIAAIPWVTIMLYRKNKEYIEEYLSPDDKNGYFAPTPTIRAEIINAYGNR